MQLIWQNISKIVKTKTFHKFPVFLEKSGGLTALREIGGRRAFYKPAPPQQPAASKALAYYYTSLKII
jgi:hypothetical protein